MVKKDKVEKYIQGVLDYICSDIEDLKSKEVTRAYPFLLLTFAGIDFLGGIEDGFFIVQGGKKIGNSARRSTKFIQTWMGQINNQYSTISHKTSCTNSCSDYKCSLAYYLYSFARSSLIHSAIVKGSVKVEADPKLLRDEHLCYFKDNGEFTVFIHALQLAEDFLEAKNNFVKDLLSTPTKINTTYNNIKAELDRIKAEEGDIQIDDMFEVLSKNSDSDDSGSKVTTSFQPLDYSSKGTSSLDLD